MDIRKNILSVPEASFVLGCSEQKIYRLIHAKALKAYKDVGGRPWHIPSCSIKEYITSCMNSSAFTK